MFLQAGVGEASGWDVRDDVLVRARVEDVGGEANAVVEVVVDELGELGDEVVVRGVALELEVGEAHGVRVGAVVVRARGEDAAGGEVRRRAGGHHERVLEDEGDLLDAATTVAALRGRHRARGVAARRLGGTLDGRSGGTRGRASARARRGREVVVGIVRRRVTRGQEQRQDQKRAAHGGRVVARARSLARRTRVFPIRSPPGAGGFHFVGRRANKTWMVRASAVEPRAAQRPTTMASHAAHAVLSPRVTTRVASPARVSSSARSASRSRPPRAPRVRSAQLADALAADAPDSHDDGATIAAIATPVVPQAGGVAIIRLSGPDAVAAARAVFRPASRDERDAAARGDPLRSHVAVYGTVRDDADEVVDEVLLLPMLAPRSYTAEDVVEIHCHGGSVCVQRVLALLLRDAPGAGAGAGSDAGSARPSVRLARPGEFTLRAFLNGRLDLTQAEAVQALVSARTDAAADGALAALRGGLAGPVRAARASCVDLLAELEARLDFDDEMEPLDEDDVAAR